MGNDLLGGDHLEAGSVLAEVDPLHVHEPLAPDDHSGATRFGPSRRGQLEHVAPGKVGEVVSFGAWRGPRCRLDRDSHRPGASRQACDDLLGGDDLNGAVRIPKRTLSTWSNHSPLMTTVVPPAVGPAAGDRLMSLGLFEAVGSGGLAVPVVVVLPCVVVPAVVVPAVVVPAVVVPAVVVPAVVVPAVVVPAVAAVAVVVPVVAAVAAGVLAMAGLTVTVPAM